jgi:hypothetical protein
MVSQCRRSTFLKHLQSPSNHFDLKLLQGSLVYSASFPHGIALDQTITALPGGANRSLGMKEEELTGLAAPEP